MFSLFYAIFNNGNLAANLNSGSRALAVMDFWIES